MNLYTFLLEYKGGTYISQVEAASIPKALSGWAQQLDPELIEGFSIASKIAILDAIPEILDLNLLTPIKDLQYVWTFNMEIAEELALVNLVQTVN